MITICKKCNDNNWGIWISSKTRISKRYCKTCQRLRATLYNQRRSLANGSHTRKQWLMKLSQFDKCPGCNLPWTSIPNRPNERYKHVWTKDHIVGLVHGGSNDISNIQPLCYKCNFGKRV